jgi:acyl-coenzyme A thioesterase PaaI-like protein
MTLNPVHLAKSIKVPDFVDVRNTESGTHPQQRGATIAFAETRVTSEPAGELVAHATSEFVF